MSLGRTTETATIPNAGTTSATVTVPLNKSLLGFRLPAALTGTSVSFKMGIAANDTLVPVYTSGTLYSLTVAPDRFLYVDPQVFRGCSYLQVVSGSAEGASRDITLVFGEV